MRRASAAAAGLPARVDAVFDEMVDTRRFLHAHPELSFGERQTTEIVADRLAGLGLEELPAGTPTGAVFAMSGGHPGRTVVLRADLDALPVHEAVALAFSSRVDGVMHACGHDAHTAALLGAASVLSAVRDDLSGRYVFLFQPAEEQLGGALRMIEGGVLTAIGSAGLIGHHVTSLLPVGFVGVRPGVAMAAVDSLRITLRGAGGHGAMPGAGGSLMDALGRLLVELASVVEGLELEGTPCVCTAGATRAGTAPNVVASQAVIEGTLRTFTPEQRQRALDRLQALCERIEVGHEVTAEVDVPEHAAAVVNDEQATTHVRAVARDLLGDDRVLGLPPLAPSDDVSELLRHLPGCYFIVGAALADGSSGMHHSPTFSIDEECLRVGCTVMAQGAVALASDDP